MPFFTVYYLICLTSQNGFTTIKGCLAHYFFSYFYEYYNPYVKHPVAQNFEAFRILVLTSIQAICHSVYYGFGATLPIIYYNSQIYYNSPIIYYNSPYQLYIYMYIYIQCFPQDGVAAAEGKCFIFFAHNFFVCSQSAPCREVSMCKYNL